MKIRDSLYADEVKPEPKTILDRAMATGIGQALGATGFFDDQKPKAKADQESNDETRTGGIFLSPLAQILYDAAQS